MAIRIGAETLRRALSDGLSDIAMISSARVGRETHESRSVVDEDDAFQQDERSAALTRARAIRLETPRCRIPAGIGKASDRESYCNAYRDRP